ncbi:MAG TPA: hypothetical protein VGR35_11880 [Tepidisphaeraceae bacterium]|nr:hypothetical protein [Tepidisphaeraceae bacterium]
MTRVVHALCLLIICASPAAAQDVAAENPALAERLAAAAQETLRTRDAGEPSWRASAALLRAATRLAPAEPRFARLLTEAVARIGDDQATIDALSEYRRLVPSDQSAQIEQIDLYLRVMETADAKLNYLRRVSESTDVFAPIRAHAAFRLAEVLGERSEMQASDEALALALKLDPLNLDALAMSYARLPSDASPELRVAALLALLRSNPAQAQVAAVLARELAGVGLFKASLHWYNTAFGVYRRTGMLPSPRELIDYAAQAYIAGELEGAETLLGSLLGAQPENIEAWLLRLIVARGSGDKEATERVGNQAATAIANRLAEIRRAAGDEAATTQPLEPAPAEAQWPEPAATLERVKAAAVDRPELLEAFADAALSAAWFKLYFEEKPNEAQPWIEVLRGLLIEGSQTLARLEGWAFLLSDKRDEARVKLSAAADTDPLAALGMLRLTPSEGEHQAGAEAAAQELLAQNGSGLTGATIVEALAFRGIKPAAGEAAAPVTAELEKFPATFTRILDAPGGFYSLRVEPVKVSHQFAEPILLRVTIQNTSELDLTLGADGIIRPDLWVDAQLRGVATQPFPGVAFDRLGGPVVLPAKQSASQVIRANQGELSAFLATNPTALFQLAFTVMTNPIRVGEHVGPAPAGQRITSARLVERRGTPFNPPLIQQQALAALSNGPATEKIRQLELVTTFAQLAAVQENPDEQAKAALASLREVVRRGAADGDPHVRAYAMYCSAILAPDAERPAAIEALAAEPLWSARLLAVLLAHARGGAEQTVARLAESDPDELVQAYAAAVSAIPSATTQPAAQPAAPERTPGQ